MARRPIYLKKREKMDDREIAQRLDNLQAGLNWLIEQRQADNEQTRLRPAKTEKTKEPKEKETGTLEIKR